MIGKSCLLPLVLAFLAVLPRAGTAQIWPARPITLIVPFPAGGANDIPARELAGALSSQLGQQVVIENPSDFRRLPSFATTACRFARGRIARTRMTASGGRA